MEEIKKIQDLIDWNIENSKNEGENGNTFLFRGMSNKSYKLAPKISRAGKKLVNKDVGLNRINKLKHYLDLRLPAYGFDYHNSLPKTKAWRELFIAQHYGVPTNLLDFTRNPLAALFFACETRDKDGIIYAISVKSKDDTNNQYNITSYNLISEGENGKSPYEINKHMFIVPPQFDQRIKSQNSVFCCFPINQLDKTLQEIIKSNNDEENNQDEMDTLFEWEIKGENKQQIMNELNKIGINHSTIYPDMFGLGGFLSWKLFNIR